MVAQLERLDLPTVTARRRFRNDIQGLRGLAVLLVVAFHAGWGATGGFVGVDMFFVVSGFLIGGLLLSEVERTGRIALGEFFARRVRRLLPALATVTTVTLGVSLLVVGIGPQLDTVGRTGTAASLFSANLYLIGEAGYFAPDAELNPLLHTWSLSVEEQFYAFFPLLFVFAGALWQRTRWRASPHATVAILTACVVAASLWLSWALSAGFVDIGDTGVGGEPRFAFFAPFTRAWEFALGALLAIVMAKGGGRSRRPASIGTLGIVLVAFAAFGFDGGTRFPGVAALVPVAGTLLLLVAGSSAGATSRVLSTRPLTTMGDLSYSWYLWHWPAIVFAAWLFPGNAVAAGIAAIGSLVPAAASYRFIELPLRRDTSLVGRRAARLAALCVVVPAALGALVVVVNGLAVTVVEHDEGQVEGAAGFRTPNRVGCPDDLSACEVEPRGPGLIDVAIVGDSHAAALGDGLEPVLDELGLVSTSITENSCGFVQTTTTHPDCVGWQEDTLEALIDMRPAVVVINGYTTGRVTEINSGKDVDFLIFDDEGERADDEEEALELYTIGITDAVRALVHHDMAVLIVSTVPDFDESPLHDQSAVDAISRTSVDGESTSIASAEKRNAAVLAIERALASRYANVEVVDPIGHLCSASCDQVDGDVLLYRDTDHISALGARRLTVGFLDRLIALHGSYA